MFFFGVVWFMAEMGGASYVVKLVREPGKRESRYAHCFSDSDYSDNIEELTMVSHEPQAIEAKSQTDRISALEEQVEFMQMEIDELRQLLEKLL